LCHPLTLSWSTKASCSRSVLRVNERGGIGTIVKSWVNGDSWHNSGSSWAIASAVSGWPAGDGVRLPTDHHAMATISSRPHAKVRRSRTASAADRNPGSGHAYHAPIIVPIHDVDQKYRLRRFEVGNSLFTRHEIGKMIAIPCALRLVKDSNTLDHHAG
jgi:hypothetical protein